MLRFLKLCLNFCDLPRIVQEVEFIRFCQTSNKTQKNKQTYNMHVGSKDYKFNRSLHISLLYSYVLLDLIMNYFDQDFEDILEIVGREMGENAAVPVSLYLLFRLGICLLKKIILIMSACSHYLDLLYSQDLFHVINNKLIAYT